jgi:hypothetical protein
MYLKYHKAGLTPTTPVTSTAISSVKMSIGRKSPEALGILGITDIYLNDNFEPTTPFLSDQKNLILS